MKVKGKTTCQQAHEFILTLAPAVFVLVALGCGQGPSAPVAAAPDNPPASTGPISFDPLSLQLASGESASQSLDVLLGISAQNATEMYLTTDSTCVSGGVWESYSSTKTLTLPLQNQINYVYLKVRGNSTSPEAESGCIEGAITHDNLPPTIHFTSPTTGSYVNQSRANSIALSGTCSEDNEHVKLTGAIAATGHCSHGHWAMTLNLSLLVDGNLQFQVSQKDTAGNSGSSPAINLIKDTVPPLNNSITINSPGATITNNANVTLSLESTDASAMFITDSPTCAFGGSWEAYATTRSWILPLQNSTNTVYIKFRDLAGNESSCISQSIIYDNFPPSLTFSNPTAGSSINIANVSTFSISGACSENDRPVVLSGAVSMNLNCQNGAWATNIDANALADGSVALTINHQDLAGNQALQISRTFTKDTLAPTLSFLSPVSGTFINLNNVSSFTLSGACSEDTLSVNLAGDLNTTTSCLSGAWSKTLNLSAFADGPINITMGHSDAAGNPAASVTRTYQKVTTTPTLAVISPIAGTSVNIGNQTNFTFSGSCSEEGQSVLLSGAFSAAPSCTSGSWTQTMDLSALPDGPHSASVDHQSGAGNSAVQIQISFNKDTISPTLSLSAPISTDFINSSNVSNFTLTGLCSETGRDVIVGGDLSTTIPCTGGGFSESVNLTSLIDGPITLTFSHSDLAGNQISSSPASVTLTKDVASPSANSLVINSNAAYTSTTAVTLTLGSTGAAEMFVTEDSTCTLGGIWESFVSSKVWNLSANNSNISVYAKFRDLAGNVTPCVSDSVIHDDIAPLWADAPTHAAVFSSLTESPVVTYSESATDDLSSGIKKYQYAIGSGTSGGSVNDIGPWTDVSGGNLTASGLLLTDGNTYFVNMRVLDQAGNLTQQSSIGWTADTTPPALTVTSPLNNQLITESDLVITGTCDTNYPIEISYGPDVTGPSTLTCAAGVFTLYTEITGITGNRNVTLEQTDSGNNTATWAMTFNYQLRMTINGQVLAQQKLPDGSTLFGGAFNSLSLNRDMYITRTSTSGVKDSSFFIGAGFDGPVSAFAELADGSLIVGGDFTKYRGRPANRIAKLSASGALDLTFNPPTGANGASGFVRTLTVVGSYIYLGGDFLKYRGTTVNRIAKVDSTGMLDTTFTATGTVGFANSSVLSIAADGGSLYVGGGFTSYRGGVANRIAKLNLTSGSLDTTFNPTSGSNGANNTVRAVAVNGSDIFLGGDFTAYKGTSLKYLAKLSTNGTLDGTFNTVTGPSAALYALATDGTTVYIGGTFSTYKAAAANRIAKLNYSTAALDTTFSPASGANGAANTVNSIALSGGNIYIGGLFLTYRSLTANRVAKLASDGSLDTTYNPNSGANGASGSVNTILSSINGIYLGGNFYSYRNFSLANYIAKLDATGNLDTTFNPQLSANGFNSTVRAFALSGTNLYVGGDFTTYRGTPANRIAKLDVNGTLDTTFNPASGGNGTNNPVWAIATYGSDIFIGGDFTSYKGTSLKYLAKLSSNGALDSTFSTTTGSNSSVYSIVTDGSSVFIGGKFTTYKSASAKYIAKLTYGGAILDTTFSPPAANGVNNTVYSLLLDSGGSLYLGGTFTTYLTTTVNRVCKLAATTGALDTAFTNTGTVGFGGTVNSLATDGTSIYATGAFTTYRGASAKYLAKVSTAAGTLSTTFASGNGLSGSGVVGNHVFWDGTRLMVGGQFTYYQTYQFGNSITLNSNGDIQ
jgi:hypothetical protein